jgi:hypothetical protein
MALVDLCPQPLGIFFTFFMDPMMYLTGCRGWKTWRSRGWSLLFEGDGDISGRFIFMLGDGEGTSTKMYQVVG